MKSCINHRAIATFIEVLAFLYWFFNTLQKYIYVQNSRCVLFWNHFFHNDALPPKRPRKLFCTKSVSESCEKWNMKMYLKLQLQVPSQDFQPTMRKSIMFMNVSLSWFGKAFQHKALYSPAEGSSFKIISFSLFLFWSFCFTSMTDSFTKPTTGNT